MRTSIWHAPPPVWTEATRIPITKYRPQRLDACRLLRKVAIRRRDELVAKHGSIKAALKFVYEEDRGKAAHADRISLEYDLAEFVGDQLQDAELLRYMARVAIEHAWTAYCPPTRYRMPPLHGIAHESDPYLSLSRIIPAFIVL